MSVGVSVLFLLFAGSKEADTADMRANAAWNRVIPLVREGSVPPVLPRAGVEGIQVVDPHGRVVAASRQLVGKPPMATFRAEKGFVRAKKVLCPPAGLSGCMTVTSSKIYHSDGVWLLYVAVPVTPWYGTTTALFLAIGVSVLVTAMMVAFVFRDITAALRPVNAIREELAEITSTGLDRRVPVSTEFEEFRLLAETANDTLDRLEGAYQQLRRFTSDASHDLRSPITAMRTQLEEALTYPQDTDWPRMTKEVLAGVERLQAIVADLLTLARLDARAPLAHDPIYLGQLVSAEVDRRSGRIEIVENLCDTVLVVGDRLRIIRVLANLLDNAERHAVSRIIVTVRADGPMATLEVLDDGAGIAVEHRDMVFERFTRLDASRNRDAGGTGLGLSIAREIAEAHQGTLTIQDSERGARFVLRLPLLDTALGLWDSTTLACEWPRAVPSPD